MHRLWRAETGIFLCVWLYLLRAAHEGTLIRDPGVLWHGVVGEQILSRGSYLRPETQVDSFSFTFAGQPWIAQQWLAECIMALLYRVGGLDSVALAAATILAALHAWVAHRLIRAGFHWLLGAVLALLLFFASAYHFHPRPHLATIVLLGWTLGRLCDVESGRRALRSLVWLVPVFIVWTNLHGGVLGGMATIALVTIGWVVARGAGLPSPLRGFRDTAFVVCLVLVCGLTALVNPYGVRLIEVWRSLSNSPTLREFILEHQPLNPRDIGGFCVLLLGLIYLLALAGCPPRQLRMTWLVPLVWLCLACTSIRHGPLFSITAVVALADVLPQTRWATWLAANAGDLYTPNQLPIANCKLQIANLQAPPGIRQFASCKLQFAICNLLLPTGLVLTALLLQALSIPAPLIGHGSTRLDPNYWPVDLLPKLSEQPDGTPIFNDMLYGGYVVAYAPNLRVFIDDRCELYGDAFIREYFEGERDDPARLEHWADRFGFQLALVRTDSERRPSPFDRYLQTSGWRVLSQTAAATLYQRAPSTGKGERAPEQKREQ